MTGPARSSERDFPTVRLIRNPENSGFARGNNIAVAAALGETLLLLNPDVVLTDPASLSSLAAALSADPALGLASGRLIYPEGRHQVGDAGYAPTAANLIRHAIGLTHLSARLRGIYLVRPDRLGKAAVDVDWLCGACLMVRRAAIRQAGGLDESLFLYAEDVEFGCRLRVQGWRAAYLPGVRIVHLQGQSEAQVHSVSTRWLTSLLDLHVRLYGTRRLDAVCWAFAVGFWLRALRRPGGPFRVYADAAMEYRKKAFFFEKKNQKL